MAFSAEYASNHPTRDEIQGIVAPTVLEFGSPDCPHCQEAEPKVKAAFQDFPASVTSSWRTTRTRCSAGRSTWTNGRR